MAGNGHLRQDKASRLDGLLKSKVQWDPPISQVAQLKVIPVHISAFKRQELGGAETQGHPSLQSKFKGGVGYLRPYSKINKSLPCTEVAQTLALVHSFIHTCFPNRSINKFTTSLQLILQLNYPMPPSQTHPSSSQQTTGFA